MKTLPLSGFIQTLVPPITQLGISWGGGVQIFILSPKPRPSSPFSPPLTKLNEGLLNERINQSMN